VTHAVGRAYGDSVAVTDGVPVGDGDGVADAGAPRECVAVRLVDRDCDRVGAAVRLPLAVAAAVRDAVRVCVNVAE
jgi:hypothetical protein